MCNGRKEGIKCFYLMMYSTNFIYGYIASDSVLEFIQVIIVICCFKNIVISIYTRILFIIIAK